MQTFKSHPFQMRTLFALSLLPLLTAACMQPKAVRQDDPRTGDASFEVKPDNKISATSVAKEMKGMSLAEAKKYTLSACLTERKTGLPIKNKPFLMTNPVTEESKVISTDPKGCVSWNEVIEFNFFADEKYVSLSRKLTAMEGNPQRGSLLLTYALNPWLNTQGAPEVLDLGSGDQAPANLQVVDLKQFKTLNSAKPSQAKQLGIGDFMLFSGAPMGPRTTEDQDISRSVRLLIQPSLMVTGADGQTRAIDLKRSRLSMDAVLVATIQDGTAAPKRYHLWSVNEVEAKTANGFDFRIDAKSLDKEKTSYMLLIRVSVADAPAGLKAYEGLLLIGSHAQLTTSEVLPKLELDSNIKAPTFSFEVAKKSLLDADLFSTQNPAQ